MADLILSAPFASSQSGEGYIIFGINSAPTDLLLSNNSINENVASETVIGTFTTTDPNVKVQTFSYSLVAGNGDADNDAFVIDNGSLKIKLSPDFESKAVYNIRVKTTDQGGLSYEKELTINVNDLDDEGNNTAPTDLALTAITIDENVASETVIGTFITTDSDAGDTFTYSLIDDDNYPDNGAFSIDGGNLKINQSPDFETKSSYLIKVKTTDQDGLSYEKELTINVNDINETGTNVAPTDLALTAITIDENVASETVIGTFITTDSDAGDTFTYSLVDDDNYPDNSAFSIDGENLKITQSPDFETKSSYLIKVKTTDQDGLSYEKELIINVNDINETGTNVAPTDLALTAITIDENVASETVIGTFITTDSDAGDTFTYSLVDDDNYPDNSVFSIDGENLKINQSPDFETKSSYLIKVKTTDQDGLFYEKELTINVNDINEGPTSGGSSTTKLVKISDDVFQIQTNNSKATLEVTLTGLSSSLVNELGAFTVDDAAGTINGIAPGEVGYAEAALANSKVIFSAISKIPQQFDANNINKLLGFDPNDNLRFYVVKNGSTDSVKAGITSISNLIFPSSSTLQSTDLGNNNFSLAWEDGSGNPQGFEDLVVKIQATDNPLPLGTGLQDRSQGENIDLRDVSGLVTAEFTVYREAAFDNYVGFYKVTDENGGIDIDGDGTADILPGQSGYTQAVVNQHLSNLGLSVTNGQTANFSGTLEGGAIYVPFLIVNSRPDAVLDNNVSNDPAVYFTFLGANSDQTDHVRLLGDNTFGFEDLVNGGDGDFNDIVVKFELQAIA
ncbi:cadherin domain-containing protein [Anabaena cylindrica FACHB-243]|nr:cadherin domain-containing protein [Anabaena cylindrica FACHB-243]